MKKTFKNTAIGFLGVFLMAMMLVVASGAYPNPFVSDNTANVAIVYGASAAATDVTAADSIVNSLASGIVIPNSLDRILSDGVTNNEVTLGLKLSNSKIKSILTDNQISSLLDGKIEWYDGSNTKSYNVHEELIVGGLEVKTTLDNNNFEGVALTNNKVLEYKYVFDDDIFTGTIDLSTDDAEPLEVTILGKEYLIESVTDSSVTVTNANKGIFEAGDSFIVDGITLTVNDIYSNAISVNNIFINENKKRTINGVQVKVDTVYYKDSTTLPSKVKLYYGGDISQEYSTGEAYIGENKDDPEWVWSISNPGEKGGYIGVKYDIRQVDEKDDVVYEGGEYTFPNDFATVSFDGLTDVDYSEYNVYFDNVDLYPKKSDGSNGVREDDIKVTVIKGENIDSFRLSDDCETNTLYLRYVGINNISLYYMDLDKEFSTGKPVLYGDMILETITENVSQDIVILVVGDTEMNVSVSTNRTYLYIGNMVISLGLEDDDNDGTITVDGKSIRTKENNVMDHYGTIIESPESNMDDDRVVLRIPSERVYAQISVLGSEEDLNTTDVVKPTPAELNITKVTDGQVPVGKNIIVVGGSCINTMAADLLGGKFCGAEFTAKTGVGAGQVLIQTFDRGDGNIATLVAGYEAADTQRGVAELLKGTINIAVGERVII